MDESSYSGEGLMEPGEHSPEAFAEREPQHDHEFEDDQGAPVERVHVPNRGDPDLTSKYNASVYVAVTPQMFLTQVVLLRPDGTVGSKKSYPAGEARRIAQQIRDGNAPALKNLLGADNLDIVADYIVATANMCSTLSIGEMAGMENLDAYQNGDITMEEFVKRSEANMNEFLG